MQRECGKQLAGIAFMFTVNNLIIYPLRHTLAFSFAYVCAAAAVVCAHYYINDNLANWERPEKVINSRFCASAFGLGALPKTHTPLVRSHHQPQAAPANSAKNHNLQIHCTWFSHFQTRAMGEIQFMGCFLFLLFCQVLPSIAQF